MVDAISPPTPILGHVEGVQLMQTGLWPASTGPFEVTVAKIASAIEALDCSAVRRPVLKLGHDDTTGQPAIGWVDNLRTDNEGQTLVGDFRGMPAWLTEVNDAGESVLNSAYPDRSIEGDHNYRCTKGHTHPFVVSAVALLGVELPAIGTLTSLIDLYGVAATAPAGEGSGDHVRLTTHGGEMPKQVTASATTDDVRRAFYDGPGQNWELWIREMYIDPAELIVNNDESGVISRLSYSIDAKGAVTFGELEPVKIQYVAARLSAGDRAGAWAARGESRAGMPNPQTPAGVPPAGATPTGEEPAVAFSDEQLTNLRKLAGVADDADEDTILAALDEAVGEAAPVPPPQIITPPPPVEVVEPVAATATASANLPEGAVVIDRATLERIQEQGRMGAAAAQRLANDDRDREIAAAVKDGKFPPASVKAWAAAYDRDPEGTKTFLASMPKNLVPVALTGHGGDPDEYGDGAEFDNLFSRPVGGGRNV